MATGEERLAEIKKQLERGKTFGPISVRDFLGWFGAQRRGSWVVWWIKQSLGKNGLATNPDFESAYIDSQIDFILAPKESLKRALEKEAVATESSKQAVVTAADSPGATDPTYRISKLAAANNSPVYVAPDASKQEAITIMLANDFSQLPVMTTEREVKGVISWTSIGTRLALGRDGERVRDLMDTPYEIRADASMFQAIPVIVQHQYVLVRGSDNRITGIVTASDLSLQFQQLAEPFLLLGEIENHIRLMLVDKFADEELSAIRDAADADRKVSSVADLTFGEYIRLLEHEERFERVRLAVDRKTFCKQLDEVRRIRNDVMHFDPDGIPAADLEKLRDFARFLQRLNVVGAQR